ncbi:hypothetical protein BCR33DRAFT_716453 [Rhizoclosmatium globosum]|uniref:F-box domain-containing protein n=1 Tax=Rhizoclosmatium globosum TaxID=329046 RepID=A0A1Y2CE84_9FUNG|nr:hypothetical protein BCR33DRAFT_716453 [Rhizoclosmatium globosum]|eukprot:ORY45114.1 hypothetical protein BCR33DRAFT_716453 [Rhizoclosmatium globosum]
MIPSRSQLSELIESAAALSINRENLDEARNIPASGIGQFCGLPVELLIHVISFLSDPRDWKTLSEASKSLRNVLIDIKVFLFTQQISKRFSSTLIKAYQLGQSPFTGEEARKILPYGPALFSTCIPNVSTTKTSLVKRNMSKADREAAIAKRAYYDLILAETWLTGMDPVLTDIMRLFIQVTKRKLENSGMQQQFVELGTSPSTNTFVLASSWEVIAARILHRWNTLQFSAPPSLKSSDIVLKLSLDLEKFIMLLFAIVNGCKSQLEGIVSPSMPPSRSENPSPSSTPTTTGINFQRNPRRSERSSQTSYPFQSSPTTQMESQALVLSSTPPSHNHQSFIHILQYRLLRRLDTDSKSIDDSLFEKTTLEGVSSAMQTLLFPVVTPTTVPLPNPLSAEIASIVAMGLIEEGSKGVTRFLSEQQMSPESLPLPHSGPFLWNTIASVLREREEAE